VAQKRGFNFSLARHYDKAVAVVVLLVLLLSLFQLARQAADSREQLRRFIKSVDDMRPKYANLEPQPTDPFDAALRSLRQPQTVRASTNDCGLFIPQHRVWCVVCTYPIAFSATNCTFCEARQPLSGTNQPPVVDVEGKGIPNRWRIKYWNHPFHIPEDKSRAEDDADADGFTNLEEFQADTNPRDPASHPELAALLRYKDLSTRQFPFVLMSASVMPDKSLLLIFNMKADGRTIPVKKGEMIGKTGIVYSNCTQRTERVLDPKVGVPMNVERYEAQLVRQSDGKMFVLRDKDPRATMEQEVQLTLTAAGKTTEYRVAADGILELDGQKYKVSVNGVDEKAPSVVIENILTGKKFAAP
jgi:hypothetical protein